MAGNHLFPIYSARIHERQVGVPQMQTRNQRVAAAREIGVDPQQQTMGALPMSGSNAVSLRSVLGTLARSVAWGQKDGK